MIGEQFLWAEKFRPSKVDDVILPSTIKDQFKTFVEKGDIPNLILSGTAGVGKTTLAKAVIGELKADCMFVNASRERGIDIFRTDLLQYCSTVSFSGGRKYVILDEADSLTSEAQLAFRAFIETHSKNCGFILTCNNVERLIEAIRSRCTVINFSLDSKQKAKMAMAFHKRAMEILKQENVPVDPAALAEVIKLYLPDWRKIIGVLQFYSATGKIDAGIVTTLHDEEYDKLFVLVKDRDFTGMRKWVADNTDYDAVDIIVKFYNRIYGKISAPASAQLVILASKYQYQHAFAANKELNLVAFFAEAMIELQSEWSNA